MDEDEEEEEEEDEDEKEDEDGCLIFAKFILFHPNSTVDSSSNVFQGTFRNSLFE